MVYRVEVPDPVEDQIRGWELSAELMAALKAHLRSNLCHKSVLDMGGNLISDPIRCFVVSFSLADPTTSIRHDFVFWVNDTEQPGTRVLLEGRCRTSSGLLGSMADLSRLAMAEDCDDDDEVVIIPPPDA